MKSSCLSNFRSCHWGSESPAPSCSAQRSKQHNAWLCTDWVQGTQGAWDAVPSLHSNPPVAHNTTTGSQYLLTFQTHAMPRFLAYRMAQAFGIFSPCGFFVYLCFFGDFPGLFYSWGFKGSNPLPSRFRVLKFSGPNSQSGSCVLLGISSAGRGGFPYAAPPNQSTVH